MIDITIDAEAILQLPRGLSATIDSLNHQERSLDAIRPDSYARTVTSLTKRGAID